MSMDRFHQAQVGRWAGYTTALAEIRKGGKTSHWIWYVFPQLDGLGRSSTPRSYALRDLDEACTYLRDPVLRHRYEEITTAVAEQLANGVSLEALLGGSTDGLKLVSSLTLFRAAALNLAQRDAEHDSAGLAQLCDSILQQTAAAQTTVPRIVDISWGCLRTESGDP